MVVVQIQSVDDKPGNFVQEELKDGSSPKDIAALAKEKLPGLATCTINNLQVYLDSGAEFKPGTMLNHNQKLFISKTANAEPDKLIRLCILGPGGVGKSALTLRYTNDIFDEDYNPTIEDAYRKQIDIDGRTATLDILDTAGQEDYKTLRSAWLRRKDGFILVFSVDIPTSLGELTKFYDEIMDCYNADFHEQDKVPPILIVQNKADLETASTDSQVWDDAMEKVKEWGAIGLMKTSALEGLNVQAAFADIVRATRRKRNAVDEPIGGECCCCCCVM